MNRRRFLERSVAGLSVAGLPAPSLAETKKRSPQPKTKLTGAETAEILKRNDLIYEVLPPRWVFGLPIGNGEVGGMVWVEDETKLIVTLDNMWAWDYRKSPLNKSVGEFNYGLLKKLVAAAGNDRSLDYTAGVRGQQRRPTKTYVGRLVIDFGQKISGKARLSLERAEVEMEVSTQDGRKVLFTILAAASQPILLIKHDNPAPIREIRLERISPDRLKGAGEHPGQRHLPIPAWCRIPNFERGKTNRVEWIRQEIPESPSLALALLRGEKESFVTVRVSRKGTDPVADAVQVLETATLQADKIVQEHQAWWRNFWSKSNVQVPDAQLESLWYLGLYMLASSTCRDGAPTALHGLWPPDSRMPAQYGFYIWDFYPHYWGVFGANHVELSGPYYDLFLRILPKLKEDTRSFYGWEGAFVPGLMVMDGSWIVEFPPPVLCWPGTSAWVAQLFWWQYLYTRDQAFLKEKAYPFMRECMLFYEGLVRKEDDGRYHVDPSYSPEWGTGGPVWGKDDTLTLSLLRCLIRGLLESVKVLEIREPHEPRWREILDRLADYPQDKNGLSLMPGVPYSHSHRHLSHLGPIYPGGDLNVDGPKGDDELIQRSLDNVVAEGYWEWVGWSFVWTSCIASRAGRGEMAYWTLKQFADCLVSCNTFNMNGDWRRKGVSRYTDAFTYCQDGNEGSVAALNEMLLQSWGGRIRVFPTIPSHWREAKFGGLLAEGGIEVSAVRSAGRTLGVRLESKTAGSVRLQNPFGPGGGLAGDREILPDAKGDLVVELEAGKGLWITAERETDSSRLTGFVVKRNPDELNPYGLKYLSDDVFSHLFDDLEEDRAIKRRTAGE